RIGNPRDDGAIARAKVDEASLTDVDHAVEPVEILDLHHRGNDAAERAVGRVQAPRHDEAPLRAIATALVRLAEEKPCIARLAVRSRPARASQMAEATLMPTSTAPSATSARVRVMREAALAAAVGIARLSGRRADELGHRLDQLPALDRLGQRPVCAGRKRR